MIYTKFFEEATRHQTVHKQDGKLAKLSEASLHKLVETVPFVFTPTDITEKLEDSETPEPPDLPFKTCFFEILDASIGQINENGNLINIDGIWIHEVAPLHYEMLLFLREPRKQFYSIFFAEKGIAQDYCLKVVNALLGRMVREEVGFQNPRTALKLKIGGKKEHFRISKVVYVSPKKSVSTVESSTSRQIDWSHRWTVRGHWRKVAAIGKDREGLPISGHTWVRPHEKGPENAPLVPKVRVVLEEKPPTKNSLH